MPKGESNAKANANAKADIDAKAAGAADREQWAKTGDDHRTDFARAKSPVPLRVAAVAVWLVCLAVELLGCCFAAGVLRVPVLSDLPALTVALCVVLCLAGALGGQIVWKKASSGGREGGAKLVSAGMSCLAFPPMALFFLVARNASGKVKAAAIVGALVAVAAIVAIAMAGGQASPVAA